MKLLVALSSVFALAWQCQGVKMEEGAEEQFQLETLTLAQCSSAVKKVQEAGKYTEEAILPICSSVVRSSKCDFFSEALSLATTHTDFNAKVFCKNIGEAHFCSQTMDRLLSSNVMTDLAYGECMRDKSSQGELGDKFCQKFSLMSSRAVKNDDLDTMRACYMMEAYDESDREETNSKKQNADAPHATAREETNSKKQNADAPHATASSTRIEEPKSKKQSLDLTRTAAAPPKPHAVASGMSKKNATAKSKGPAKSSSATPRTESKQPILSEKVSFKAAKNTSAKLNASLKTNATMVAKKTETSLVSSLIHTLSDTVVGVAHAVAKVVSASPTPHSDLAKPHNATSNSKSNSTSNSTSDALITVGRPHVYGRTATAPAKKLATTSAPVVSTSKGASLTQAKKIAEKQTRHRSGQRGNVAKAVASAAHSGHSHAAAVSIHHGESLAKSQTNGKVVIKQHKAALVVNTKPTSSHKVKKGQKERKKNERDEKDKYGGFLSGFIP